MVHEEQREASNALLRFPLDAILGLLGKITPKENHRARGFLRDTTLSKMSCNVQFPMGGSKDYLIMFYKNQSLVSPMPVPQGLMCSEAGIWNLSGL